MASDRPSIFTLARNWQTPFLAGAISISIVLMGTFFFVRGKILLEDQLKIRLRSNAASAAMQFDGALIERISGPKDIPSPLYHQIVSQLQGIMENVPDIRFAYILRRTDDPNILRFVADADSLRTPEELDVNGNDIVDDDEKPSHPGDAYDATHVPAMRTEAFLHATSDSGVTVDQWGSLISGYAPIRRWDNGKVVAILGIDMRAEEFNQLSQSVFSPVAFLLLLFAAALIASYLILHMSRRRVEELQVIDDERSELVLLTSHQLGTPLTLFKWSLEVLREKDKSLPEVVTAHVKIVEEAIMRMETILNSFRDAAAVEEDRLELKPEPVAIRELIDEAVKLEPDLQKFKLVWDVDERIRVKADRKLIVGVLRQVIENAIAYSPQESTVTIRARRWLWRVHIEVQDQGSGIPREDIPRLFGKFVRGSNAGKFKAEGNGLGLFISRGIIRRAGGDMWLKSTEGKGTTVTFTLPRA